MVMGWCSAQVHILHIMFPFVVWLWQWCPSLPECKPVLKIMLKKRLNWIGCSFHFSFILFVLCPVFQGKSKRLCWDCNLLMNGYQDHGNQGLCLISEGRSSGRPQRAVIAFLAGSQFCCDRGSAPWREAPLLGLLTDRDLEQPLIFKRLITGYKVSWWLEIQGNMAGTNKDRAAHFRWHMWQIGGTWSTFLGANQWP